MRAITALIVGSVPWSASAFAQKRMTVDELLKPHDVRTKDANSPQAPGPTQTAPDPKAAGDIPVGAYCEAGFDAFGAWQVAQSRNPSPPSISFMYDNCRVGDVIVIPGGFPVYAAQVCDPSRPMMAVPTTTISFAPSTVVCTLGERKHVRTRQ